MVRSKLCARTCTTHRRPVPARGPSGQDGRVKPRRELRYRRSLIYKVPILRMLGASARYSRTCVPVETSTPPRRRSMLHIPRSAVGGRARSFRCSSSSRRTRLRWAPPGVRGDCGRFLRWNQHAPYPSLRRRRQSSLIPPLLLFPPDPLALGSAGRHGALAAIYASRQGRRFDRAGQRERGGESCCVGPGPPGPGVTGYPCPAQCAGQGGGAIQLPNR